MKILICGTGSIATRHFKNLIKLGYKNIIFYKSTNKKILETKIKKFKIYKNIDLALNEKPDITFICNVTSEHVSIALKCIKKNSNIFFEKPISNNKKNLKLFNEIVKKKKLCVFVGYMMRFHPLIKVIKNKINQNQIKNIFYVNSIWGEYLPDWHKNQNYSKNYAANKKLGGGVTLTLSHELDLMTYLFGKIKKYKVYKNYNSSLKTDADVSASYLIRFQKNIDCSININYLCKPPIRKLHIFSENLQIYFDYYKASLIMVDNKNRKKITKLKNFNRNNLFVEEIKHYLQKVKDKKTNLNLKNSINLLNYMS